MTHRNPSLDERSPELRGDLEAQLDDLGSDPNQVGELSAGQSGDSQGLSTVGVEDESVAELAETDQALEAAVLEGSEDALEHPERPTHTHDEYRHSDIAPSPGKRDAA